MKYEVLISSIDHSGRGISRIDNKIVFVPKTLIGDRCIVKITKTKKNYFWKPRSQSAISTIRIPSY